MDEKCAYKAMIKFLEKHYMRTNSADIGSLLGDLSLTGENQTVDPAMWSDWIESIKEVKELET